MPSATVGIDVTHWGRVAVCKGVGMLVAVSSLSFCRTVYTHTRTNTHQPHTQARYV